MAQILIRNLSDDVHARLKEKAAREGKSLQRYVQTMLEEASRSSAEDFLAAAARLRASIKMPPDAPPVDEVIGQMREERDAQLAEALQMPPPK